MGALLHGWRRKPVCFVLVVAALASVGLCRYPVGDDFERATSPLQTSSVAIAALKRLRHKDFSSFQRACIQIVKGEDYDDYRRTWCLAELGNSRGQDIESGWTLAEADWIDPNWLNPRRACMAVSCQDEYSEFPRMPITSVLECPFATRAGTVVTIEIRGFSRREYTECVAAMQKGEAPKATCRIGHFWMYFISRGS